MSRCEICPNLTCYDKPVIEEINSIGRIMLHNNGKEEWTEDSTVNIVACVIRQRHEQKELQRLLHKSEKRQNLL